MMQLTDWSCKTGEPSWAECFAINQFATSHGSKLSLSSKLTLNILPLIIRKIVPGPPKSGKRVRWPHVAKLRGLFFLSKASWRMMLNDNPGRKVSFYGNRRPAFFFDLLRYPKITTVEKRLFRLLFFSDNKRKTYWKLPGMMRNVYRNDWDYLRDELYSQVTRDDFVI